ncbi:MAG: hypothetical protein JXR94_23780, partial [Candidatus Hydrogenedentes bacterium]|nr:hypothetical protein [Candidatus Hydrogenedentota bacterium]
MRNVRISLVAACLVVSLCGCPELPPIAWSPSGRYLAFLGGDDERLWIWDTEAEQATPCGLDIDEDVIQCRFLNDTDLLTFKKQGSDDSEAYWRDWTTGESWKVADRVDRWFYSAVSDDGKYLYVVREVDSAEAEGADADAEEDGLTIADALEGAEPPKKEPGTTYALIERRLKKRAEEKVLFTYGQEMACPGVDAARARILVSFAEVGDRGGILLFDLATGELQRIDVESERRTVYYWPTWVDEHTFVSIRGFEDSHGDEASELVLHDLRDKSTKPLCSNAYPFVPPSLTPERDEAVVIAALPEYEENGLDADEEGAWQVAAVSLETGEKRFLTDEPFGVGAVACSPKARRIAYTTPIEAQPHTTVHIMDMDTGRPSMIWRSEEERLLARAIDLEQDAKPQEAADACLELRARFPESPMAELA